MIRDAAIALLDLDGTVANYDRALRAGLERLRSPGEEDAPYFPMPGRPVPAWVDARKDAVTNQPGFWRLLAELPTGMSVYHALLELGFEVHVLTKGPVMKTTAWTQKVEWCQEHLPRAKVTITQDKSLVYGKVLVDDWPAYYEPWAEHRPRGLVIVPTQPWNVNSELPQNAVRLSAPLADSVPFYEEHDDYVLRCLRAARDRRQGEPLVLPGNP